MKAQAERNTHCVKHKPKEKFYAIVYHDELQGRTDTNTGMKTLDNLQKSSIQASEMAQWVKVPVCKPVYLSLICSMTSISAPWHMYTHRHIHTTTTITK